MPAMTPAERTALSKKVEEVLAFASGPLSVHDLRDRVHFTGGKAGFTRFVKHRFIVADGQVYLPGSSDVPSVEPTTDLCRKMAKVIDRMAQQIEALEKEIVRLRNNGSAPVLSERAKKALAVYGD